MTEEKYFPRTFQNTPRVLIWIWLLVFVMGLLGNADDAAARRRKRKKKVPRIHNFAVYPTQIKGAEGDRLLKKFISQHDLEGCRFEAQVHVPPKGIERAQVGKFLEKTLSGAVNCGILEGAAELAETYDLGLVIPRFRTYLKPDIIKTDRLPIQAIAVRVIGHMGSGLDVKEAAKFFQKKILTDSISFSYISWLARAAFALEPTEATSNLGEQVRQESKLLETQTELTPEEQNRKARLAAFMTTSLPQLEWMVDFKRKSTSAGELDRSRLLIAAYLSAPSVMVTPQSKDQAGQASPGVASSTTLAANTLALSTVVLTESDKLELRRWAIRVLKRIAATEPKMREQLVEFFENAAAGNLGFKTDVPTPMNLDSDETLQKCFSAILFLGGHLSPKQLEKLHRIERSNGARPLVDLQ